MRVVLVCGTYAPERDGVADYVAHLAAALPGAGVDPVVVGAAGGDPGARPVADRWDVRGTARAARQIAALAPDVVHVQFAPSAYGFSPAVGLLPALLRANRGREVRRTGRRPTVVTTLHEYGWWAWPGQVPARAWVGLERSRLWDRESGTLGPRSAALVVTNPGAARAVRDRLGRDAAVVPLGPNVPVAGWDRARARREVRAELELPAEATLLAFFGFVHPVKGVRYLLEALATLRRDRPDLHLVVAGGFTSLALPGEEARSFRRELAEHAAAAGVADATTFLGHRPAAEVSRVLAAADVGVLPFTAGVTTKSGSLLALWAHRLPVVVTDVATAAERDPEIVDGHSAVVVPARRDAPALAAAIARLLDDPALRGRVADAGARCVAGRSWPRVAAAHAALYRRVLGR